MNEPNPYQAPRNETLAVGSPLPVRATGHITADDAIQSLRVVGKWVTWPYPLIVIALFAFNGVLLWASRHHPSWTAVVVLFLLPLYFLARPYYLKARFQRSWKARPEHQHPVSWTFSEDGVYCETINAKAHQAWDAFAYAKITANEIVLAQHGNTFFNFVPLRMFASEQDLAAVRRLIAAKLPIR